MVYKIVDRGSKCKTRVRGMQTCRIRSVGLSFISAVTLFILRHTNLPALVVWIVHVCHALPHTQSCLAAALGVKDVELETRPTDAMVGGTDAAGSIPLPCTRSTPTARSTHAL